MLWPSQGIMLKKNQTELRIKLINQSEIVFKSAEVAENLRGATLHGSVLDEVREMPAEIWSMVIQPMLATTGGWAAFVSTPNGFDAFYDLACRAQDDKTGQWEFFRAHSTANPLFTQAEFDRLKSEMSEAQFAQEILAEFRDLASGKVYINFSEQNIRATSPFATDGISLVCHYLPVIIGLDFNVNPMAWVLCQHNGGAWYFFDEIFITGTNTTEAAPELITRLKALKSAGLLNHNPNVILCGDATGQSRRSSATQSDYAIICQALSEAGISYHNETPKSNPPVKERVNTVNSKLRSASGNIQLWISEKCVNLKRDFERVSWKDGADALLDQSKDKKLTHLSDAAGYPVCAFSPIEVTGSVGVIRILR